MDRKTKRQIEKMKMRKKYIQIEKHTGKHKIP